MAAAEELSTSLQTTAQHRLTEEHRVDFRKPRGEEHRVWSEQRQAGARFRRACRPTVRR